MDSRKMLSKAEIENLYQNDQNAEKSSWPFQLKIEFSKKTLILSALTHCEQDEWLRVLKLIESMNKLGLNITDKNPYQFEEEK